MRPFHIYPDLLYIIPVSTHNEDQLNEIINANPNIQFVSFVGIDLAGNDTDEKIPISNFLSNIKGYLNGHAVQTDGSSVVLPGIATLNDGQVDFETDADVNWFVDYNYEHLCPKTNLPVGTLRVPSFLVHNGKRVCSRSILKRAVDRFSSVILDTFKTYPHVAEDLGFAPDEVDHIDMLVATELEFWVSSPDETISAQLLSISESLKEQYWKRTKGVVRTALEQSITLLELYGFDPEMAHKEVGGVKAHLSGRGEFHNIMEQLEIDWKYSTALQSADYELLARIFIKEVFRMHGLDVSFSAKPLQGVAGSGEHTHVNAVAYLKNGRKVNIFSPKDMKKDFLSIIGWGALMGFMKHYSLINPFISVTSDAFLRLQPGFEAPTHPVVSLGKNISIPSRNRTVLIGLIRNMESPSQTRMEIRSPNPHTNTYLCLAATYQCMLEGIDYAASSNRDTKSLEKEFCKPYGEKGDYLEQNRLYRSEDDIFVRYSAEERDTLFGKPPSTVYDSLRTLLRDDYLIPVLCAGGVFSDRLLASYAHAMLDRRQMELADRIIPDNLSRIRQIDPCHDDSSEYDVLLWKDIQSIKYRLAKDTSDYVSIFKEIRLAIDAKNLKELSRLQQVMNSLQSELLTLYSEYLLNQI